MSTIGGPVPVPDRAAAAILIAIGLGFGIPTPFVLAYLARTGDLPMTPWGFRAMSGPFERLGPEAFTALGVAFAGVCAVDVVAGTLLWRGDGRGRTVAAAVTPAGVALGLGFALPFYLASIPLRSVPLLLGRRR